MMIYSIRDFRKVVTDKKILGGELVLTLNHEYTRYRKGLPWSQLRFTFWRNEDGDVLLLCTKAKGLLYRVVNFWNFPIEDRGEFFWDEFEDMLCRKFGTATGDIAKEYVSEFRRLAKFMKDFVNDENPKVRRRHPLESNVVPIRRYAVG